jgi:hypothetical protein
MALIMSITMVLSAASTLMLLVLIYIYYTNFKKIKSSFTLGLMLFALLFLVQNLVSLYYYFTMMEFYVEQVSMHVFVLTLLQAIAFAIMLKLTWE